MTMRKALMLASAGLIVLAGCSPANDKAEDYSSEAAPAAEATATARDASTDCMAGATDFATGSTATAALTCNHTGDMIVDGYNQASIGLAFTRSAGTAVRMQCDYSVDSGTTWRLFDQINLTAATVSATVASARVSRPYSNLVLNGTTQRIGVSTTIAQSVNCIALGGDF
jgi:putative hemolysin